jgi:hypothetical protein
LCFTITGDLDRYRGGGLVVARMEDGAIHRSASCGPSPISERMRWGFMLKRPPLAN